MKRHVFAAAVGALLVVLPIRQALRADSALYTIEDLGLMGGFAPTVTGMNASGQVSGFVTGDSGLPRAVVYTNGRGWEDVPGTSSFYSVATGINDNGEVVGYHHNGVEFRAFRYSPGPGLTSIEPLPGGMMTLGRAIDALGNVVGQNMTPTGSVGFRAAPGLPAVALPTLGGSNAIACGINAAGQIAGFGANADGVEHAFRIEPDNSLTVLLPFDGATGTGTACAIDAAGRIGGKATNGGVFRAFRFESGAPVNVDTFAGSETSNIEAISAGVAVGWFISQFDGSTHAVVNTEAGSSDLNDLVTPGSGWTLDQAFAVNADGSIAGNGRLNGQPRPFRLTRVPEAGDTTAPTITEVSATPSTIAPPNGSLVPVTVAVTATDDVDAAPSCELSSIGGTSLSPDDHEITGPLSARVRALGGRTYTLTVTCSDTAGNQASAAVPVYVPPDTTAPVISSVVATPGAIWPPNGKMVAVSLSVAATDDVDAAPQCSLNSIVSNGGASADAVVTGPFSANVRAEKNADGSLRTYTLKVSCRDAAGNKSWGSATVVVTKDNPTAKKALVHKFVVAKAVLKALLKKAADRPNANAARKGPSYLSRGSSR